MDVCPLCGCSQLDHADVQLALAARRISQQHEVRELFVMHLYIDIEAASIYRFRNRDLSHNSTRCKIYI